jgi:hypothetical protein
MLLETGRTEHGDTNGRVGSSAATKAVVANGVAAANSNSRNDIATA